MSEFITISGLKEVRISTTAEARAQRDALLLVTKQITTIANPEQANLAANVLKDVKGLTRLVEAARTAVKAPVLDQGKQIDGLAKELTLRLDAEASRISQVLGVWQAEQNRLAEEARRKAWQEEQRIREEAAAAERVAAEKAEAEQAELQRKQLVARTAENADRYAKEAEARSLKAKHDQEQRDLATEQAIVSTRVTAAAVVPAKPAGISTRNVIRWECTDATALYEAAPYLVSLVPNVAAINSALKGLTGEQKLPGIRHWNEAQAIVR